MSQLSELRPKPFEATNWLKELMTEYYQELDRAAKNKNEKVAWCTSVGPAELLLAFDFKVYYPENHGAILGTTRTANTYIPVAHAIGYSPEICSYLTSDIGAFLKNETPLLKAYGIDSVPKPDVLVYNTNQCRDVQEWFSFYARKLGIPILGINSPCALNNVEASHIKDVAEQLKQMKDTLEEISGTSFEIKRLKRKVTLSLEGSKLWKAVLNTAVYDSSPLTFFDGCIQMAPAVCFRGEQRAIDYYKVLLTELEERILNGVAAVDEEKFRLYWEGMPIWGKLRQLATLFMELRTCIVASTYCNSWIFETLDPTNPFESMAKAYLEIFICRSEAQKEKYIAEHIKRFKIDGVIFHDSKTCPNNSNARYGMPRRLQDNYQIPTLVLDGDLNDLSCYSEEQATTNIEAFIEQLEGV